MGHATRVTSTPLDTTNAFKLVPVGGGNVESSARQVIRTPAGVVYVFAQDDTAQRTLSGPGVARAWKGNVPGIPTAFAEVDGAHRPTAGTPTNVIVSIDARLDRSGIVHLVYIDETTTTLYYRTFSTITDTWGPIDGARHRCQRPRWLLQEPEAQRQRGGDHARRGRRPARHLRRTAPRSTTGT